MSLRDWNKLLYHQISLSDCDSQTTNKNVLIVLLKKRSDSIAKLSSWKLAIEYHISAVISYVHMHCRS